MDVLVWILIFGAGLLVFIIGLVIYYLNRRHRNNIFKMSWRIPKEELKIIDNKNADQKMVRELDHKKHSHMDATQKKRVFASYALVGTQRGEFLRYKQLKKISWQESQKKFIYALKQLQNDNLTKFLGVMDNDGKNIYFLNGLIDRASLEDFALDPDFAMDNTFKSAFMRDICKGLLFLHKSPIGYHGFLNSCTCLIDGNWVLKLTHYGFANIIFDLHADGYIKAMENAPLMVSSAQYAWFAPEHLKEYDATGTLLPQMVRGSKEGDIYCLGLIFYQLLFRRDPFSPHPASMERASPTLIHDIISNNHLPDLTDLAEEEMLVEQCRACWDRDPSKRPSIKLLLDTVNAVYPSAKGNLVDQMIKMSETYAENLERTVAERTTELAEAEQRTMILLNEMLPASIAQALKEGLHIPPRSYPSATVMFVQLCDFAIFMNNSTPNQIIDFLNDIFDQFDIIIRQHDAYKVETTGETYMVASGVPNENDGRHIYELAEVGLKIRDLSYDYVVEHKSDFKVRVKIGFHAGPIAAGVIGVKSPRYCLFGDTVNFASRMQSNCPPNQIQTSEQTAMLLINTHEYKLVKRGIVHVKGKGEVNCYWLNEHIHEEDIQTNTARPLTKAGNIAQMAKTETIT